MLPSWRNGPSQMPMETHLSTHANSRKRSLFSFESTQFSRLIPVDFKQHLPDITSLDLSPGGWASKESYCNAGDPCSIPGLGTSPGEGNGYPEVLWPGEFHGLYSPQGHKESETTDFLTFTFSLIAMARTSKTMLNYNEEGGYPCLVPDLKRNAFSFLSPSLC